MQGSLLPYTIGLKALDYKVALCCIVLLAIIIKIVLDPYPTRMYAPMSHTGGASTSSSSNEDGKLGYIRVATFSSRTVAAFQDALEDLRSKVCSGLASGRSEHVRTK